MVVVPRAHPILVVAVEHHELGTRLLLNGDPTPGRLNGLSGAMAFRAAVKDGAPVAADSAPRQVIAHLGTAVVVAGAWRIAPGDSMIFALGVEVIASLPGRS